VNAPPAIARLNSCDTGRVPASALPTTTLEVGPFSAADTALRPPFRAAAQDCFGPTKPARRGTEKQATFKRGLLGEPGLYLKITTRNSGCLGICTLNHPARAAYSTNDKSKSKLSGG